MTAYTPGKEACRVHALLRYLDQLFMLVFTEMQYAQSSIPLFQKGYALVQGKLNAEEQAVFMQHFNDLAAVYLTPGAPPAVADMHAKISAIMRGEAVPEEEAGLREEELDLMSLGYIGTFVSMAAADGKVGNKEVETFESLIQALTKAQVLGASVIAMTRIPNSMNRLWPIVTSGQVHPGKFVEAAARFVKERLDDVEQAAYHSLVITLAEATAQAEGGGFLGLGSKISKEERVVLDGLKRMLGRV